MQSSTAIAFRALVMLICLISVPLFAIFGKDLPEVIKGLLEGRLSVRVTEPQAGGTSAPGSTADHLGDGSMPMASNPFGEAAPYRAAPEMEAADSIPTPAATANDADPVTPEAREAPTTPNPASSSLAPPASLLAGSGAEAAASPVVNAGMTLPSASNAATISTNDWPASTVRDTQPENFQPQPETRPIGQAEPSPSNSAPQPDVVQDVQETAPAPADSAPSTDRRDDQFRRAEMRLRELGASHYLLETWGPENNRYRFACKMAVGGKAGVNRYFQAIEDDPWRAMEDVLQQVEQWRTQTPQ